MKKIYILTLLLCFTSLGSSFAQTLKGHIYDANTNEPLVGAAVAYKLQGNQGVVSDIHGNCDITQFLFKASGADHDFLQQFGAFFHVDVFGDYLTSVDYDRHQYIFVAHITEYEIDTPFGQFDSGGWYEYPESQNRRNQLEHRTFGEYRAD